MIIDQRQLFDLVLSQQLHRIVTADSYWAGDQWHWGHDLAHRARWVALETHVPVRDNSEQPEFTINNWDPGDMEAATHRVGFPDAGTRGDGDRLLNHARLRAFHDVDLVGLILDGEVAVDDAEASLPGNRDRHPSLGDGIHR